MEGAYNQAYEFALIAMMKCKMANNKDVVLMIYPNCVPVGSEIKLLKYLMYDYRSSTFYIQSYHILHFVSWQLTNTVLNNIRINSFNIIKYVVGITA